MLNDTQQQILRYIFEARTPTTDNIFGAVFNGSKSKSFLYRTLKNLENQKLIVRKPLYAELGAASPNYYRLTAKGGRTIGIERLPSTHYRYQLRMYYDVRVAKRKLIELVSLKQWMLVESEKQCERVITLYLEERAKQHGERFVSSIPIKISPDLVLYTGQEACVIIISHPNAGREAIRERIKKYHSLLYEVRIICINTEEDQFEQWVNVIGQYDAEHKTTYESRFLILMAHEIGEIPRLLN